MFFMYTTIIIGMLGLMYLFILNIYLKAFGYQAVTHLCIIVLQNGGMR